MWLTDIELCARVAENRNLIVVMPTPDLLRRLTDQYSPVSPAEFFAARRYAFKELYGEEYRVTYAITLHSLIKGSSRLGSVQSFLDQLGNHQIQNEEDSFVIVGSTSQTAAKAATWAYTLRTSQAHGKAYVDENLLTSGSVILNATLNSLQEDRNAVNSEGREYAKPVVTQELWTYLCTASTLCGFGPHQVFYENTDSLPPPHDDSFNLIGTYPDALNILDLPNSFDLACINEDLNEIGNGNPPRMPESDWTVQPADRISVVDANRAKPIVDLKQFINHHELTDVVLLPASVRLEIARKALFGDDAKKNSHRKWAQAADPGHGIDRTLLTQQKLWAEISRKTRPHSDDTPNIGLRVVGAGEGSWHFVLKNCGKTELKLGESDLLIAALRSELKSTFKGSRIEVLTGDTTLRQYLSATAEYNQRAEGDHHLVLTDVES